jgi:7-cyano-7-deazaguanine synthase
MDKKKGRSLRVVALVSGGLESAVLIDELLAAGHTVIPCYVEGGHIWEGEEKRALQQLLEAMAHERLTPLARLALPVADCYGDHWSLSGRDVPNGASPDEAVELPGRNLLLVAKAAVYAAGCGADALALGPLKGNPFADATPAFFGLMAQAASQALGRELSILTPLALMNKVEVLKRSGGIPVELTFSCISPVGGLHCGRCNKCAERARGFIKAGLADPTLYCSPPLKEPL